MSLAFISATAARMVFVIKADNPKIGYVGLVYIGNPRNMKAWRSVQESPRPKKGAIESGKATASAILCSEGHPI